jgi:alkanesulfonate monooxygenase SsuD/methylene tetrahydromethanopterin reductase-like flavin-dependent oxidoreductase (luciferase family)
VPGAAARRQAVDDYAGRLQAVWSGATGGARGFLRPDPPPPVIIAGFGPKMAELAGRVADGINTPGGPSLPAQLAVARAARERAGRDPSTFLVTASGRPAARDLDRLRELGVDRAIIFVGPPYGHGVEGAARALS